MRNSPRSKKAMQHIIEGRVGTQGSASTAAMERVEKPCRICRRSCNEYDPVQVNVKLKWGYEKDAYVDPDTGLEVVAGKVDFYCDKVVP